MAFAEGSWLKSRPGDTLAAPPLTLRRFHPDHAAALTAAIIDSLTHLSPWMAWAVPPVTLEGQVLILRQAAGRFQAGTDFGFLMFSPDGEVVGASGLHARRGPGALEIGYWVRAGHTREGYATTATGRLVEEAFKMPEVHRLEIRCDEANVASAGVARRVGFELVRVEDRQPRTSGETHRELVWERARPPSGPCPRRTVAHQGDQGASGLR
ncbi:MAG: GNAT family N-acetyltransferase [Acidimicrobiales bacterium]